MKKRKILLIVFPSLIVLTLYFAFITFNKCSYSLIKEEKSVVNQYKLYVNNKSGKHINGKVDITYLNGKKQTIDVSKDGNLIIKSVIKKIDNPKRR